MIIFIGIYQSSFLIKKIYLFLKNKWLERSLVLKILDSKKILLILLKVNPQQLHAEDEEDMH